MRPFMLIQLLIFCLFSCQEPEKYPSPPGYDLNKPIKINLPAELNEISGLSYYEKDRSVFAISDETGWLYKINAEPQVQVKKWKISKKKDYEDVVMIDSVFFILQSNGNIHIAQVMSADTSIIQETDFPFGKGNEFETLYYDSSIRKLILICKRCQADDKNTVSTFSFDPATYTFSDSSYKIDTKKLDKSSSAKSRIKPSAAAIHPVTGELYILCSVDKLLVVADRNGVIKKIYPLDPVLFKQPEGLTFTSTGKMIISNESGGNGSADLLIYNYQKK